MPTHLEKSLFIDALELADPAKRKAFLDQACAGNPPLRSRLDRLLNAQTPADTFFSLPLTPGSDDDGFHPRPDLNSRIGRYELKERLGEGGCGVVYLAEQQEPVRRPVALKIIRLGMDTENVIARFEAERQSLALMDHPNIARVLDAGATESGRPYFVMEVVQGVKITDYCDQNRLDIAQRLDLFIRVCHAIQHAHQKGVIHLDIKPSNILITRHDGLPVPKLIDFGIAKATGGHLADHTTDTAFAGTPAYMSPEQAATDGADVDTRGDIYSLGVLLCELLTGHAPFDAPPPPVETDIEDLRRIIRERRANTPSALLASLSPEEQERISTQRRTPARRLLTMLRDDLDCIVLKALENDRRDRYETANALAMDVRRCLDHEPVAAHFPGRLYRLRKLVRRNRGIFVAGTLVALALVTGLGTSTWLFLGERDARREQARLREQAEIREEISRAAVLISHGEIREADTLLADLAPAQIPSSLESAQVMRTLGGWHALAGRWDLAAARFAALAPAIIRADPSDTEYVSRNLLPVATALCEFGDRTAYDRFRRMALEHFAQTTKPVVAEHVIKACLLLPTDPHTLRSLVPLANLAAHSLESKDPNIAGSAFMAAWRTFALSLFAYRQGNDVEALKWARQCLDSPDDTPARRASAHIIHALACHRLHQDDEARTALAQGRELIDHRFRQALRTDSDAKNDGFWFDWINARILLREAALLIASEAPQKN
ncbi:MAG: serine/threonine protein kinase [Verrucomicrobia bacterium]|nr:serine/threonine protein kinase [Verrucomicrobiota bacterium]